MAAVVCALLLFLAFAAAEAFNISAEISEGMLSEVAGDASGDGDACLAHVNAIRKKHGVPPYKLLDAKHQKCTAAEAKADAKSGKAHGSFPKCGEYAQGVAGGSCIKAVDAFMSEWPCKNCHASGVISKDYHSISYGQSGNHVTVNYYYCPESPCDPIKTDFMVDILGGQQQDEAAAVVPERMGSNKTTAGANTLAVRAVGNACKLPPANPPPSTGKFSRQECLNAINMYRGKKGLSSIKLCSAERQTLADRMVQYDGDRHSAHAFYKNCGGTGKGGTGQCEAGRFGSAARAVEAYWNEGPPKKGGFNHYSIMMNAKNTCVACGFSQKNYNLGNKQQTWTYAHNFYSDHVSDGNLVLDVLV